MMLHRHDLLDIADPGRVWAARHLAPFACGLTDTGSAISLITGDFGGVKIPCIARREEGEGVPGAIPVGFSSPYRIEGRRFRVASFVPPKEITRVTTPYRVLEAGIPTRTTCLDALAKIKLNASSLGLRLGVWGSAALELYTGLPYTDQESDLDLLVEPAPFPVLESFYRQAAALAERNGLAVELELDLPTGYGVKVVELLGGSSLVLGKSLGGVDLISRSSVIEMCAKAARDGGRA